jgi:hypothetical protein
MQSSVLSWAITCYTFGDDTLYNRERTPRLPTSAPTKPRTMPDHAPVDKMEGAALLKGTYDGEARLDVNAAPVPPPVKLAPFDPIGLESSANAHEP